MNLQYRPVRGEERDVYSSSLLIDAYALFRRYLRRQASMTQAEKFPDPLLLKSDVNLFNHLVRKADAAAGCCSAGSVLRRCVALHSVSLICIVWSCLRCWCRSITDDTCVIIDYLTWLDGLHARCDMQMIIIITLRVLSVKKGVPKKHRRE